MGTLMATCPATGQDIELGIETDKFSLKRVRRFRTRVTCPRCGGEHTITKRDSWVCETFGGSDGYSPAA